MNNDLISRSALRENIKKSRKALASVRSRLTVGDMEQMINGARSVDAEVVRHGRWIAENIRKKSYLRQCSACSKIAYFCGTGCSYNYCPNCGAKMDEEVVDNGCISKD